MERKCVDHSSSRQYTPRARHWSALKIFTHFILTTTLGFGAAISPILQRWKLGSEGSGLPKAS